jgi:ADP-ribosylglycohydrolase
MAENNKIFTLVELLNEPQPYNELSRLQDTELSELDINNDFLPRIQGSLVGLAVGDALGASVEFRPNTYMAEHPVSDMQGGGTWGLEAGQWTDDTSMALCLAASLIAKDGFNGYDQLVRYKRWFRNGYMSSTGECFDIGTSTRQSILEFEKRQRQSAQILQTQLDITISEHSLDKIIEEKFSQVKLDIQCGALNAAGNGPLMRLAPIPLFYFLSESDAIQNAGSSARFTHGHKQAIDTCRFYSALIWNAVNGISKNDLLDSKFFCQHFKTRLDEDVMKIIEGSYKNKNGYIDGIRGKGFILNAFEAALWAFYNDENSFEKGVLLAVNLGDDTDTTAAIYGQLAGAVYGIEGIPQRWRDRLFQKNFLLTLANGLYLKGKNFNRQKRKFNIIEDAKQDARPNKLTSSSSHIRKPQIIPEYD